MLVGVKKDQLVADGRQPVVDDDLLPLAAPPDPEPSNNKKLVSVTFESNVT